MLILMGLTSTVFKVMARGTDASVARVDCLGVKQRRGLGN